MQRMRRVRDPEQRGADLAQEEARSGQAVRMRRVRLHVQAQEVAQLAQAETARGRQRPLQGWMVEHGCVPLSL